MKFFSPKAITRYRKTRGETDWKTLWPDYERHLDLIWPRLSPSWRQLAKEDFHDAEILSFERVSKSECVIALKPATLKFYGVRFIWVPSTAIGDCWIYWELALADDDAIDLQVALSHFDEIRIIADEVEIGGKAH